MRVYVNDEKRELRIIDRASGINVAKMVTVWNLMRDMVINILMETDVDGIAPDFASEIFSDINGIGI